MFQKISYLIDLRRGDRHIYGLLDFCMFVMFFPQLIAGPIVRHNEIIPQFAADPRRPEMWENLSRGFILFIIGVAKKVALADTLAMVADPLFHRRCAHRLERSRHGSPPPPTRCRSISISPAIPTWRSGSALMFGLRLPFNFNAPYRAVSVRDFWRRWHMTLSRFLRDYLYIPLGGNRVRPMRQAVNVVATMLLGGLWHGASWTFVAWGGLHGVALAVNHFWAERGFPSASPRCLAADAAVRHGGLGAVPGGQFSHRRRDVRLHGWACTASAASCWIANMSRPWRAVPRLHCLDRPARQQRCTAAAASPGSQCRRVSDWRISCCCWAGPAAECLHLLPVLNSAAAGGGSSGRSRRRAGLRDVIYGFVALVDPWDALPLSPPAERWPVATNARFSFPALARSAQFDSAVFGTSTSRLLRPAMLNPAFDARFANLAMNDATVFEQITLMDVFRKAHPEARAVMLGVDVRWCVTGDSYQKLTRTTVSGLDVSSRTGGSAIDTSSISTRSRKPVSSSEYCSA